MATIGVSTEFGVVSAVVLADDSPHVLHHRERDLNSESDPATAAAVASILDALEAQLGPDEEIDGTVVACQTAAQRMAIESRLASGRWKESSLVSGDAALLATVRDISELDEFATLLVYELAPNHKALSVVNADRTAVLASDTTDGDVDAGAVGRSTSQAWSLLDSVDATPDAILVLGASAEAPEVAPVLELVFEVPVVQSPESESAEAIGAALLARDIREPEAAVPVEPIATPRRDRRALVVAASAAVLALAGFGITALATTSAGSDAVVTHSAQLPAPAPAPVPAAARIPAKPPTPAAERSSAAEPAPAAPTVAWTPPPAAEPTPVEVAPPQAEAKVGQPDVFGLFPGETPPPGPGSDPATIEQWWEHHGQLKDRWLHGG